MLKFYKISPILILYTINIRLQEDSLLRHYATGRKGAGLIHDQVIRFFFNLPIPSIRIMALGLTQPLTKMSTRNLPGGKGRPVHKADNLTAICEPIV
jgi:hypothetical protein